MSPSESSVRAVIALVALSEKSPCTVKPDLRPAAPPMAAPSLPAPSLPALSLSSTFTELGALLSFVALFGIALLALLAFSQAREIRRLREWAGRAPERAAELEQRVSASAASRVQQPRGAVQAAHPAANPPTIANPRAPASAIRRVIVRMNVLWDHRSRFWNEDRAEIHASFFFHKFDDFIGLVHC